MPLPAKREEVETVAPVAPRLHISSRQVPPGGYWFRIVDPPHRVGPFNDIETCYKETNKFLAANGRAAVTLGDVEQQNCDRLPPGFCRDSTGRRTTHPGALALSLADVISGTKALVRWFRNGSVSNEEIVRRTHICNDCPENLPIAGCQGCAGNKLREVSERIVVKPLPSDAVLGACSVCKCSLKTKTRFKLEDLHLTPAERAALPEKCWMIAEASPRDMDPRL